MKEKPLSPKEKLFCFFFTDLNDPEVFGKSTAAAEKAKLSKNCAVRLLKRDSIQREILRLYELRMNKSMMSPSKVLTDLEHTRLRALEKGDLAAAARCSELMGKTLNLFSETITFRTDSSAQLDASLLAQSRRIASMVISNEINAPDPLYILPPPQPEPTAVKDAIKADSNFEEISSETEPKEGVNQ